MAFFVDSTPGLLLFIFSTELLGMVGSLLSSLLCDAFSLGF
jgi:hypothetical protein